jgi:hypothetical protein
VAAEVLHARRPGLVASSAMPTVESARREWEEGSRRFREEARDPVRADLLHRQVDVVTEELRRRVGATFTLAQLADAYDGAERWLLGAVEERAPARGCGDLRARPRARARPRGPTGARRDGDVDPDARAIAAAGAVG